MPQTGNLISGVPDVRWYTDITYIETTDFGSCSFIEIEDSCTRDIRAWNFLASCGTVQNIKEEVSGMESKMYRERMNPYKPTLSPIRGPNQSK